MSIDWSPGSDWRYVLSLTAAVLLLLIAWWRTR